VPVQRVDLVGRAVEDVGHVTEPEPELPQQQHVLQPQQLGAAVPPHAAGPGVDRSQQADVVVVAQRPGADPGQPRHLGGRPALAGGHGVPFPSLTTVGVDAASTASPETGAFGSPRT
jgi:hypothetical protein